MEPKNEFVVRTRRPAQYFRGEIHKGYFPIDGKHLWHVNCLSFAGGNRNDSPIRMINWKEEDRNVLVAKINKLARRGKYILSFNRNDF